MMYKKLFVPALALCALLGTASCSEETTNTTTANDSTAVLTADPAAATPGTANNGPAAGDANVNAGGTMNGEVNTTGTNTERVWDETKGEWKEVKGDVKGAYKEGKQETKELVNDGGKGD